MDGCSQCSRRHEGVSFQLAFSRLEIFANRLWKIAEPDTVDVVYGRIWLHSLELAHRFSSTTVADALAGIHFTDEQASAIKVMIRRGGNTGGFMGVEDHRLIYLPSFGWWYISTCNPYHA